jgi:hypothetical protein
MKKIISSAAAAAENVIENERNNVAHGWRRRNGIEIWRNGG